jgi:hypothetical protein
VEAVAQVLQEQVQEAQEEETVALEHLRSHLGA